MLDVDTFKWNKTELFQYLHKVAPKDFTETHNILEVKDDMLFVWNEVEKCLLSLNWRASMASKAKTSSVPYQVSNPRVSCSGLIKSLPLSPVSLS